MTQTEFKEMFKTVVETTVERTLLEMLGDPDEGLEIRADVRDRLLRQRQDVVAGQHGQPLDDPTTDGTAIGDVPDSHPGCGRT